MCITGIETITVFIGRLVRTPAMCSAFMSVIFAARAWCERLRLEEAARR